MDTVRMKVTLHLPFLAADRSYNGAPVYRSAYTIQGFPHLSTYKTDMVYSHTFITATKADYLH